MANEGLLKFDWPVTGLATFTADILEDDSSTRQSGIAFSDAGHLGRYKNTTSIPTIEAGDSIKVSLAGSWAFSDEYQPEVTVANIPAVQSGLATEAKQDIIDTAVDRVASIQEADKEIDLTTDPLQGTLNYKTKGTSTVILKKDLKRPGGGNVTTVEHLIAAEEDVTP